MKSQEVISPERLHAFFRPKSIALIGATDNSRWSLSTFMNLKNFNYKGTVYCVNPYKENVHGQKAYKSVLDIDEPIDLAYVMVSTEHILDVLKECADANIQHLVLLTSGFSEIGEEGKAIELKVLEFAKDNNQIILGPNGNGFIHTSEDITPYGLPLSQPLEKGPVGIILQSGALASSVVTLSQARQVGLSLLVSMGNEAMLSTTHIMDYLIEDKSTKVIAMFLESIRQPDEFKRLAQKALSYGKPIIVMKIGRSAASARSAMAHTGALVGDDNINDAVFRQYGVIRVHSLEDLITTAGLMGNCPTLQGRRMGVVTPSGGACDILSDRSEDEGILLPAFSKITEEKLLNIVPEFSTVHNPLDVTGYVVVDRTLMLRALEVVANDDELDFVICLMEPPRIEPEDLGPLFEQYEQIKEMLNRVNKPIIFLMNSNIDIQPFGRKLSKRAGIHFVGGMEHGITAIGKALWWYEKQQKNEDKEEVVPQLPIQNISVKGSSELRARRFLEDYQVPVVPGILATNEEEVILAARQIGYPVVLKIQSDRIAHKSDVGGVALNIQNDREVEVAFNKMLDDVMKHTHTKDIDGVLVSPMRQGGIELLVGIIKDPLWGLTLAVGMGGVFVEVFKDTSVRLLPTSSNEIREMLTELHGFPLLNGARGRKIVDMDTLCDTIYNISQAAMSISESLEALEVNPLLIQEDRIEALDALIEIKTEKTVK